MKTHNLLLAALLASQLAGPRADVVECENGDRYNGKVLLVDEHNVKLQNDITGVLSIPRAKVSVISFGNPKPPRAAAVSSTHTNLAGLAPLAGTPDAQAIEQVQNQILGGAGPEANQMFEEMVRGLMSGKMNLGDLQVKARSTLDDLKALQKELGDDDAGALLGSYASILENFVKQMPTNATPRAAAPVKPERNGKE